MKIKRFLKTVLPSYKSRDAILNKCEYLSNQIIDLKKHINHLNQKNDYLFWLTQQSITGLNEFELKKQVFLSMPKAKGTIREIQLAEEAILREIKRVCDENDIEFFLSDGTLIGAERHRGFIPWDDDIDISMMRKEYLKFRNAIQNNALIEVKRYYCYYQYHDCNTLLKVKFKNNDSIFVDIFIYDYIDCEETTKRQMMDQYNQLNIIFHKELSDCLFENGYTDFQARGTYVPKSIPEMDKYYDELFQKHYDKFNMLGKGNYFCLSFEASNTFLNKIGLLPCEHFFPMIKNSIQFEGHRYDCLANHCDYLFVQYGDIWSLPDNISPHHLSEMG